jgi:putative Mn2+ efflux pump MntP
MLEALLLAAGLAMDAVAACAGLGASERTLRPVLLGALLFGVFQAGMAALGWGGGVVLAGWVAAWDHWLAFVLLVGLGLHVVWEALAEPEAERTSRGLLGLVGLAIATSLDSLAAGLTLPVLEVRPLLAVGVIGLVTGGLSLLGGLLGRQLGDRFGPRLEIVGGVVLVALGVKILLEHTLLA